ncbi:MAG: hypothetical protein RJP95_01260 [Pirellulales bacterium]
MPDTPKIDIPQAHRHFSVYCFNSAWKFIDKTARTDEDQAQMILRAMSSLWHWTQRPDCSDQTLSIGYWQVARVLALAGYGSMALDMAEQSLEYSVAEGPFYEAYAHEAIARAAKLLNDESKFEEHAAAAKKLADKVDDAEERKQLLADLKTL